MSEPLKPTKRGVEIIKSGPVVKTNPEDIRVKNSLNCSTAEGVFNAASGSITESYITPFALALGANNLQVGLLTSLRDFASTIAQIPGAKLTQFFDRKSIWLFVQIISKILLWVPIVLLPAFPTGSAIWFLIILFAATGFFASLRAPAWSSLMGDLVPTQKRGSYFGLRNTATGASGIAATLAAGYILTLFGFPILFTIAIVLSLLSIPIFMKMHEPSFKKFYHYKYSFRFDPRELHNTLKANRSLVIFTVYIMFMYFAVEVASPFYSVYMLRDLNISYVWFGGLTVVGALARILSFKYWGKLNDRFGSRTILIVTGIPACITPLLWTFVFDIPSIAALKLFDGFIWAGFDMVIFNYLLDATPAEKRPQYVANHNFVTGMGTVLGALIGGFLAQEWSNSTFLWMSGLQLVFMTSFVLRLFCLGLLPKIGDITVRQSDVPVRYVFWKAVAVDPAKGMKNSITVAFQYPYEIEKKFKKEIDNLKFKVTMMKN
jgi:MFS family permease